MPAVALVLSPHGPMLGVFSGSRHRFRIVKFRFVVPALIAFGRNEFSMHSLMRQMHKVGLLLRLLLNPVERVISKFVGNVALLRYMLPVDIQSVFLGQVRSLTFKTHPMIESGLGIVARIPHVPLTEKRRL